MTGVRIITEAPNIENTIPVSLYQASSPEKYSLEEDDKFVLYGGGTNFYINILNNDPTHELTIDPQIAPIQHASLFVLNTSFIIWLEQLHRGLDIGYPSIILHALQQLDNQPALYLQLVSNDLLNSIPNGPSEFTSSVEIVITAAGDSQENPLFCQQPASSLEKIYHAMSQCSSFHVDSEDSDSGPEFAPSVPGHWLENGMEPGQDVDDGHWIQNNGHADDLQMDDGDSEGPESGMNVDVGFAQIVGNIRRRDDEDHEAELAKARRLQ